MSKPKKIATKTSIKKKIKKDLPEKDRHFGVVLEDINSKMTLVLEGHLSLDKKIDNFKKEFVEFKGETNTKFETISKRLNKIDGRLDKIENRLDKIESRLDEIENRLGKVENRITAASKDTENLKNDMIIVKSELASIKNNLKQKTDIERFEQLEQRVMLLEKLIVKQ
jgi:chromosome segregation ATPase